MECSPSHCQLNEAIQAIVTLTQTLPTWVVKNGQKVRKAKTTDGDIERGAERMDCNRVQQLALGARNEKVRNAAAAAVKSFSALCVAAEAALEDLQGICLACSRTSNDDNPSNHGQTFVSLDALANNSVASATRLPSQLKEEHSAEGEEGGEAGDQDPYDSFFSDDDDGPDPTQATGDFIHRNAVPSSGKSNEGGCTPLPFEVEDHLRKMLHSFAQLSVLEQNLVFQMMHGSASLSDFATMNWVPPDMRRRQSKQWVSQKWNGIVSKFPVAAVLRKMTPLKDVASERTHKFADEQFDQMTFDFGGFNSIVGS